MVVHGLQLLFNHDYDHQSTVLDLEIALSM